MQADISTVVLSLKLLEPTKPSELLYMDLSSPGILEMFDKSEGTKILDQVVDQKLDTQRVNSLSFLTSEEDLVAEPLSWVRNNGSQQVFQQDLSATESLGFDKLVLENDSSLIEVEPHQSLNNSDGCAKNHLVCLNSSSDEQNELQQIPIVCDQEEVLDPLIISDKNVLQDNEMKIQGHGLFEVQENFTGKMFDNTNAEDCVRKLQSSEKLNSSPETNRASTEDVSLRRLSLYSSNRFDDLASNSLYDAVHEQGSSSQENLDRHFPQLHSVGEMSASLASMVDSPLPLMPPGQKSYDYLLKFLLVGDSDVGKQEILADFEDGTTDSPFCSSSGAAFKTTTILIDGKRVKLQLWDTSGQGRFCTIIRSYSRGAQGILLVYDITNKWSFEGIDRWLKEVDQHAPGIPKVLVGNRLHFEFRRQVNQAEAEDYAQRNFMGFFEVSPLVNFNISESFTELARMALKRNGMERLWRSNKVSSLYEICAHAIVNRTAVYGINRLPLPESIKQNLKSYALTNYSGPGCRPTFMGAGGGGGGGMGSLNRSGTGFYKSQKHSKKQNKQPLTPADAAKVNCGSGINRKSCVIS